MDTFAAIQTLKTFGLSFQPVNGRLFVTPRDRITAEARKLILEHRNEILAALGGAVTAGAPREPQIGSLTGEGADEGDDGTTATAKALADGPSPHRLQSTMAELRDPSAEIEDYLKRLAVCTAAGVSEVEAHQLAVEKIGASIHFLAQGQVEFWHSRLVALSEPRDHRLDGLAERARAFTTTALAVQAARCGWTGSELFGLDPSFGAQGRIDYLGHGVLPSIHLSSIRGPWRFAFDGGAPAITCNTIAMIVGSESRLSFARHRYYGPPLWLHPQFSEPAN